VSDSVARDYQTGAIGAAATVYEYRASGWILQERQNFIDLAAGWFQGTGKPDPNVLHSGRLHGSSLPLLAFEAFAQIEYCLNSHGSQFRDVFFLRLLPAINVIVNTIRPGFRLLRTDRRNEQQHQADTIQAV